jgi:acetylglutamate kinase
MGIKVVLVHGGGPQVSEVTKQLGLETKKLDGRRVTCEKTLDVATMVLNGTVNTHLLAAFRDLEVPAIGISGVDAGLIRARRRPPQIKEGGETLDYGCVGDIVSVNVGVITGLLAQGYVPVVSPLCADDDGQVLNVNADVVASRLAVELSAQKLMLVTDVPGILENAEDPSSLVSYTDIGGLNRLKEAGSIVRGMLPKVEAVKDALYGGVGRVHMISHRIPDSLLMEVFTNEGSGTLIVVDTKDLMPEELNPTIGTRFLPESSP